MHSHLQFERKEKGLGTQDRLKQDFLNAFRLILLNYLNMYYIYPVSDTHLSIFYLIWQVFNTLYYTIIYFQSGFLDVVVPPDILNHPDQNVDEGVSTEGGSITLLCSATGISMIIYFILVD